MEIDIENILKEMPDIGIKKISEKLKKKYPEINSKEIRIIVSNIKIKNTKNDNNNENKKNQSEITSNYLHHIILTLIKDPVEFTKNLQSIIHVLDGRFGSYTFDNDEIKKIIRKHPMYGFGDINNTPLESCKLVGTIMRILCSKYDLELIKSASMAYSHSAGAFTNLYNKKRNYNVFGNNMKNVINNVKNKDICIALHFNLSDLYIMKNPYSIKSFSHIFTIILFLVNNKISAKIYQGFGPPQIGYSLIYCCKFGTASKIMDEKEIYEFISDYEAFENSMFWNIKSEKLYRKLFKCKLSMEHNHPIECYTSVHINEVNIDNINFIYPLLIL